MYRASSVLRDVRYMEAAADDSCTEDYSLWMRLAAASDSISVTFRNLPSPLLQLRKHDRNISSLERTKQNIQSHNIVRNALLRRMESDNQAAAAGEGAEGAPAFALDKDTLNVDVIACLQRPEASTSLLTMERAASVLLVLEKSELRRLQRSKSKKEKDKEKGKESSSSTIFIVNDTTARMGAIAMLALQKYGSDAIKLVTAWQARAM